MKMPCMQNEEIAPVDDGTSLKKEFSAKDVEELVIEIQENMRLRTRHSINKQNRVSPYSFCDRTSYGVGKMYLKKSTQPPEEPYNLLQELLKEGSLIKEAVKRLQNRNNATKRTESCNTTKEGSSLSLCSNLSLSPISVDI